MVFERLSVFKKSMFYIRETQKVKKNDLIKMKNSIKIEIISNLQQFCIKKSSF